MKTNRSALYILPLIKGWSADADFPLNCYAKTEFDGCVIVIYAPGQIMHGQGIILEEDADGKQRVLFAIKNEFMDDYHLLIDGKYSKISDEAKAIILSRAPSNSCFQIMEEVLYKSKKIKKSLESRLDIENIDLLIEEYESKPGEEEVIKIKS